MSGVNSVDISARFCYFIPAPHPTTPPGQFQHTAITTRADISTWTFIFNFQSTVFFRLPVTWMWCLEIIFVLTYIVKSLKVSNEDIEVLVHSSLNVAYKKYFNRYVSILHSTFAGNARLFRRMSLSSPWHALLVLSKYNVHSPLHIPRIITLDSN